jgi:hypothetical protein
MQKRSNAEMQIAQDGEVPHASILHSCIPAFLHSCIPAFLHSCIPAFLHSCIPAFLHSCIPAFLRYHASRVLPLQRRAEAGVAGP